VLEKYGKYLGISYYLGVGMILNIYFGLGMILKCKFVDVNYPN
jgi:hypothetical protein